MQVWWEELGISGFTEYLEFDLKKNLPNWFFSKRTFPNWFFWERRFFFSERTFFVLNKIFYNIWFDLKQPKSNQILQFNHNLIKPPEQGKTMSQPMPISGVNSNSEVTVLVVQTPCILGCKRKMPITKPRMSIPVPSTLGCKRKIPIRNNERNKNIKRLEEELVQLEKENKRLKREILEKEKLLYENSNCE